LSRFENYLQKTDKKLTFEQEQELSSIVAFLDKNYGFEVMLPYTDKKLDKLYKKDKDPRMNQIMESLGFEYRSEYARRDDANDSFNYYYYENDNNVVANIHGYDFMFTINQYNSFQCNNCVTVENKIFSIKAKSTDYGQDLQINEDIIPLKINDFINADRRFKNNPSQDEKIEQRIESSKYTILMTYISANGIIEKNKKSPINYQIKVMVGIKK